MELRQPEDMPELLRELGIKYDPDRLAQVLKNRPGKVRARAIQVTAGVGAFIARLLRVSVCAHTPRPQQMFACFQATNHTQLGASNCVVAPFTMPCIGTLCYVFTLYCLCIIAASYTFLVSQSYMQCMAALALGVG